MSYREKLEEHRRWRKKMRAILRRRRARREKAEAKAAIRDEKKACAVTKVVFGSTASSKKCCGSRHLRLVLDEMYRLVMACTTCGKEFLYTRDKKTAKTWMFRKPKGKRCGPAIEIDFDPPF